MKKLNLYPLNLMNLHKWCSLPGALLLSGVLFQSASAQTVPTPAVQPPVPTTPLNLDSDTVVKEMSKEQHPADIKTDTLSASDHLLFEQSILNSENRKKVFGVVEAGAGVGSLPGPRGGKSEQLVCENTGVAIVDEISPTTQVGVSAQVNNCKTR